MGLFSCLYIQKWDKNEVFENMEKFGNNWKTNKNTNQLIKNPYILYVVLVLYICTQFGIYCIVFKNINMYAYSGLSLKKTKYIVL